MTETRAANGNDRRGVADSPGRRPARARRGGREARHALRAAGTEGNVVRPGLNGGAYKPLTERDMQRIYDTALAILENIGIADPIPEILH